MRIRIFAVTVFALSLVLCGPSAFAQETTSEDDLRSVIEDIRDWPPNFKDMERPLGKAVKDQKKSVRKFFRDYGDLSSVEYLDTFKGIDVYYVRFRYGPTVFTIRRSERGRIEYMRYMTMF